MFCPFCGSRCKLIKLRNMDKHNMRIEKHECPSCKKVWFKSSALRLGGDVMFMSPSSFKEMLSEMEKK